MLFQIGNSTVVNSEHITDAHPTSLCVFCFSHPVAAHQLTVCVIADHATSHGPTLATASPGLDVSFSHSTFYSSCRKTVPLLEFLIDRPAEQATKACVQAIVYSFVWGHQQRNSCAQTWKTFDGRAYRSQRFCAWCRMIRWQREKTFNMVTAILMSLQLEDWGPPMKMPEIRVWVEMSSLLTCVLHLDPAYQ